MATDRDEDEGVGAADEAARIEQVVTVWGEPFRDLAAHPRLMFDGDLIKVTLWVPIKVNGVETSELTVREMSVRGIRKMDRATGDVAKALVLLQEGTTLTDREIDQVRARDYSLLSELAAAFFGAPLRTGDRP